MRAQEEKRNKDKLYEFFFCYRNENPWLGQSTERNIYLAIQLQRDGVHHGREVSQQVPGMTSEAESLQITSVNSMVRL